MASEEKKYQVFVSSTFDDLRAERSEVIQALLELDCIPAGMELFPSADQDQWSLIQDVIDDCDYYIVIIAGRYGSMGPDGLSYTEMEYRYAMEKGKPTLAFIHGKPAEIVAGKSENDSAARERLEAFKALVQQKMVRFWTSPAELGGVVSRSMSNLKRQKPAVGWVRGDLVASNEATAEILQMKRTIEELQERLKNVTLAAPEEAAGLAHGEESFEIHINYQTIEPGEDFPSHDWNSSIVCTWDELFGAICPVLLSSAVSSQILQKLNLWAAKELERLEFGEDADISLKGHSLAHSTVDVDESDFDTILVQFLALGYIERSSTSAWKLTPYGQAVMNRVRAVPSKRESATKTSFA